MIKSNQTQVEITKPDDLHLHVRNGAALKSIIHDTARQFRRAIIMPNLATPVTQVEQAQAYRQEILNAIQSKNSKSDSESHFEPLMTLYLTDKTTADTIYQAKASSFIHALKLYPAGATTNSDAGVTDIANIYPALEAMQETGIPLLLHGEVTDPNIDIFDRERVFIETILEPLIEKFPALKVVLEHITTKDAVDFINNASDNLVATITAHHLLINRNAIFTGGIRPHHYCLPVLKREKHRLALVEAAISGSTKYFLGTDSAPHSQHAKESACGCAGMYTAFNAMELYTEVFDNAGALNKLDDFSSRFGANFYKLPRNSGKMILRKESWDIPKELPYCVKEGNGHTGCDAEKIIPFRAGEKCSWKIVS